MNITTFYREKISKCMLRFLYTCFFIIVSCFIFPSGTNLIDDFSQEDKMIIKTLLEDKESFNWVFTGNSITQGAKHTHGMRSYPEIFAERVRWEMHRSNDFIINTGISGNTTQNILNDFDKRVNQFKPKVVVLMIGTNDAAERSKLGEYVIKIKEVAQFKNVVYVDNWKIWSTDLQTKYKGEVYKELLNDPLHPNGFGHQEIARALFKELSIFDPLAPTCGGEYYEGYH